MTDAAPAVTELENDTLTAVEGLLVGHWTDGIARTGCTVVLAPNGGCIGSGRALGPAPGSRESALLEPDKTVGSVDAVVLSGGSAYGLAAAQGVMNWLEEQGRGFDTGYARVPIVPAAVLYDLAVGDPSVRPGEAAGRAAAAAANGGPVQQGQVGVGAGATIGKLQGMQNAVASGIGSHAVKVHGAVVAALAVSNAVGNVVDPDSGRLLGPGEDGELAVKGPTLMLRYLGRAPAECRSSCCGSIMPATFRSAFRPAPFRSRNLAAPARSGACMRPSTHRAA